MNHVIVFRARSPEKSATVLLQLAVVLTSMKLDPDWIELSTAQDGQECAVRMGVSRDALALAPLVTELRRLPECTGLSLETG